MSPRVHAGEGRQQAAPRPRFSGTGPLRKCTCSHFLLFVWGGLTLAETGASIGTGDDAIRPKDLQTSGGATPSPCPSLRLNRHVIFQVCAWFPRYVRACGGGWTGRMMSAGLVMVDGGAVFSPPPSLLTSPLSIGVGVFYDAWWRCWGRSVRIIYLFSLRRSFWHMNGIPVGVHRHRSSHRMGGVKRRCPCSGTHASTPPHPFHWTVRR